MWDTDGTAVVEFCDDRVVGGRDWTKADDHDLSKLRPDGGNGSPTQPPFSTLARSCTTIRPSVLRAR